MIIHRALVGLSSSSLCNGLARPLSRGCTPCISIIYRAQPHNFDPFSLVLILLSNVDVSVDVKFIRVQHLLNIKK